jgi:hypothetical protein
MERCDETLGETMSEYIYIKLGDPFYEELFQQKFKGIIIDFKDHHHTIGTKEFLRLMQQEVNERWDETIEELED